MVRARSAEAALLKAPTNQALQLSLGRAQLKAGEKTKGRDTVVALLGSTDDPGVMNDAAYELADAGLELPLAEKTARAALDRMETQSQSWTLDENLSTLRQKSALLQATWDTMGWIYFKNGKTELAERYVRASWLGRQSEEVGKHLGEIALFAKDRDEALEDYELALASTPMYDMLGTRAAATATQKDLTARIEELRKSGAKSHIADPHEALQNLRKIPLSGAFNPQGVATYKILVGGEYIERAERDEEKDLKGGEDRLKRARLLGFAPPDSKAKLVYQAMLNCHSGKCELLLIP